MSHVALRPFAGRGRYNYRLKGEKRGCVVEDGLWSEEAGGLRWKKGLSVKRLPQVLPASPEAFPRFHESFTQSFPYHRRPLEQRILPPYSSSTAVAP